MWLIVITFLINASVSGQSFLFQYRVSIAGMPINILDILLALMLFFALFFPTRSEAVVGHRLFAPIVVLLVAALMLGGVLGVGNLARGAPLRRFITFTRDYTVYPIAFFAGYRLLGSIGWVKWFSYVTVIGGCLTALGVLLFYSEQLERFGIGSSIDALRTVQFVSAIAGTACALLMFSVLSGNKILPLFFAVPVAGFCLVGGFATLTRSDWISTMASLATAYFLLPRHRLLPGLVKALFMSFALGLVLWAGVYFSSQVSGHDFAQKMHTRLLSLLPGEQAGVQNKAWDSRLPGLLAELRIFANSPLFGGGICAGDIEEIVKGNQISTRHNSWALVLSETGLIGFAGCALCAVGTFVVGARLARSPIPDVRAMGAFGAITAIHFSVLGMMTGSFTSERPGLFFFSVCGMVLRSRALEQTILLQQHQFEASELADGAYLHFGYAEPLN